MRGVMPIVVTPYTPGGAVDYEDLARQMAFYDRCGCTGGAWPQGNGDVLLRIDVHEQILGQPGRAGKAASCRSLSSQQLSANRASAKAPPAQRTGRTS